MWLLFSTIPGQINFVAHVVSWSLMYCFRERLGTRANYKNQTNYNKLINYTYYTSETCLQLRNLFGDNKASTSEAKSRMDTSWLLILSSHGWIIPTL